MTRIESLLTDNQARFFTQLHHDHGYTFTYDELDLSPAERGTFASLFNDDILTTFDQDDAELLAGIATHQSATKQPLFLHEHDLKRYGSTIPAFSRDRFDALVRRGTIADYGAMGVITELGDEIVEQYQRRESKIHAISQHGRQLLESAPLAYRHPVLWDAYAAVKEEGAPHEFVVTISGERGTGTSSHARELADTFNAEYSDNGAWYREAAEELGMPVQLLRGNRKWVEYMEDRTFDLENDAHTYDVAGRGDPVIVEGRLAAAALIADRGDGNPIAPIRIKLTCDDETERAARYAIREGLSAAEEVDAVTEDEREQAMQEIRTEDEVIYDAFAETYAGVEPRDDRFYTHTVDNSGRYAETQQELQDILQDAGLLD